MIRKMRHILFAPALLAALLQNVSAQQVAAPEVRFLAAGIADARSKWDRIKSTVTIHEYVSTYALGIPNTEDTPKLHDLVSVGRLKMKTANSFLLMEVDNDISDPRAFEKKGDFVI